MTSPQWCSSGISSRASPVSILPNNLDAGRQCTVTVFAGDTKLGGAFGFVRKKELSIEIYADWNTGL